MNHILMVFTFVEMNSPTYKPIACAAHSELELAVMRARAVRLVWRELVDAAPRSEVLIPLDVVAADGAEWLVVRREDGGIGRIRLDWIDLDGSALPCRGTVQKLVKQLSRVSREPRRVEVRIEIPKGSFLKVGSDGTLDFLSPLPCPFNYGSVPDMLGLEGDLLDAVVLGPRLPRGSSVEVDVLAAVGLFDRGLYDDKLICSSWPMSSSEQRFIPAFFRVYAWAKWLLNLVRGQPGRTCSAGWVDPAAAIARARPLVVGQRPRPEISF